MMHSQFKVKPIHFWIGVALAVQTQLSLAVGPYPALPPTLSTSVTPNVILMIDNSGSMIQDSNNNWITQSTNSNCNDTNEIWTGCMGNSTYTNWIDSETSNPNTKMNIAKRVSRNLIDANPNLRWGVFSFDAIITSQNTVGGNERGEGASLKSAITAGTTSADITAANTSAKNAITALKGRTATPLGEALLEITQYFQGKASLYSKTSGITGGLYTSPIQYRCQKNFTIVITDGDASNDDVFPGFNVCTTTSASCPANLEGTSTSNQPGFGTGNPVNRFRAIRDVAKWANENDLKTTGTDLDNKSFNDAKFLKQTMQTYTVGFSVTNDVLPATAIVGGGKYYTANSETGLSTALTNAVNDIVASISNAGGVATQTDIVSTANKVFQPVFNPQGWYGELRCYNLDSAGNFNPATSQCTPNAKGTIPAVSSRKIYSSKVTGTTPITTSFIFNDTAGLTAMTSAQSTALGSTSVDQKNTINFIRGTENISGFRTRPNGLLGDIVDSQPVVISKPVGQTLDSDYAKFTTDNALRNMVFIGANDGMLHAFSISNMTELMGYIPSPVYPNLKSLTASDYGLSGGTPHEFHVNGSMRQADVKLGGNWKTILVGGLGQGGKGYYAVDATQDTNFTAANTTVKWEWTDQSTNTMGYAFGTPIIYNVRTATDTVTPAVILTNGYENKWVNGASPQAVNTSSLYIINANTGTLIKQIDVAGGIGLSSPAGVDAGQDGVLDYVYAGDMNGKLWRFDLTNDNPTNFKVISTPIYNAGTSKPIVMRPAVMPLNKTDGTPIGNLVMFGTGKLLTDADRSDNSQQSFYSILDKMQDTPTTVTESDLQVQTIVDTQSITSGTNLRIGNYRKVSSNSLDLKSDTNTKLGWYINFPVKTHNDNYPTTADTSTNILTGERIVTSPMIFDDKVLFGTGIPQSTEKCLPGGKGWIMGLNPFTGSVTTNNSKKTKLQYSFIDILKDGKSTDADKVSFSSGSAFISGYEKDGIPTELTYVASENKIITPTDTSGSSLDIGKVIAQREANYMAVYTGNPKLTTVDGKITPAIKIYKPMPKPASTGKGTLYGGTIGSDTVDKEGLLSKSAGAKVETTTWREIK